MTRDMRHRLPLLLTLLAASACASAPKRLYDGPPKPPGDVARVVAVNGPLWVYLDGSSSAGAREYEILPGTHTAVVSWTWTIGSRLYESKQTVSFLAQAGHRYRATGAATGPLPPTQGGLWKAGIEDLGPGS